MLCGSRAPVARQSPTAQTPGRGPGFSTHGVSWSPQGHGAKAESKSHPSPLLRGQWTGFQSCYPRGGIAPSEPGTRGHLLSI